MLTTAGAALAAASAMKLGLSPRPGLAGVIGWELAGWFHRDQPSVRTPRCQTHAREVVLAELQCFAHL